MKCALVTGGAGFVGTHLVSRLIEDDYHVIVLDNFLTSDGPNKEYLLSFGKKLILIEADVCGAWEEWSHKVPSSWLESTQIVFHLASPASPKAYQAYPLETLRANSVGLERALYWSLGVNKARVVFASTSEVYGDPLESPQSESYWGHVNPFGPRSCYDEAKRFGEALIYSFNQAHPTRHGIVRLFNAYGPRMNPDDGRVIINFLRQGLSGESLTIYGDGKQTRSFCYIDDLVTGLLAYAKSDVCEPVNIGNSHEHTILEVANLVRQMLPRNETEFVFQEALKDDPRKRCPDLQKARKLLSWNPAVPLSEGLERTLFWLRGRLS